MKKWLLTITLMALAAGAAYAYVQVSPLPDASSRPSSPQANMTMSGAADAGGTGGAGGTGSTGYQSGGGLDNTPTRPVPEPGTMALASMGLLALGIAAHRHRSRS